MVYSLVVLNNTFGRFDAQKKREVQNQIGSENILVDLIKRMPEENNKHHRLPKP